MHWIKIYRRRAHTNGIWWHANTRHLYNACTHQITISTAIFYVAIDGVVIALLISLLMFYYYILLWVWMWSHIFDHHHHHRLSSIAANCLELHLWFKNICWINNKIDFYGVTKHRNSNGKRCNWNTAENHDNNKRSLNTIGISAYNSAKKCVFVRSIKEQLQICRQMQSIVARRS